MCVCVLDGRFSSAGHGGNLGFISAYSLGDCGVSSLGVQRFKEEEAAGIVCVCFSVPPFPASMPTTPGELGAHCDLVCTEEPVEHAVTWLVLSNWKTESLEPQIREGGELGPLGMGAERGPRS